MFIYFNIVLNFFLKEIYFKGDLYIINFIFKNKINKFYTNKNLLKT